VTGVDGRTIGGGRDFVLVHLRREEGVAPGARYAVYYGSKKRGAPDQSFAEAVVVSVFGDQSLLRVTDARDAVSDGDRLFLRVGGVELTAESADPSPPAERVRENAARIARLVTETIRPTVESPVDSEELAASVTFEDLHFDFDRYTLRQESLAELDQVIEALNAHPSYHLKIEGHTCNVGTPEYNLALGERRAAAVRDYFISRGVIASRLSVVSYGEDDPKFDNSHKDTRKLNRRAALVVEVSNPSPAPAVKTSRAR
jgi:peptidoglycan-associated lipoprotein